MVAVGDVMSTELVIVRPTTSVAEAATVMGTRHVGSALVMDGGALVGIFTERDVLRAVASEFDAVHHHVAAFMTGSTITVGPDVDVGDALTQMLAAGFRHFPVSRDGVVVGMVSMRDLTRHAHPGA
jgi:CBS domain-containing protein